MHMKFIYMTLLVLILSISNIFHTGASPGKASGNELLQIAGAAKEQNIDIGSWSLYAKRPITEYDSVRDIKDSIEEIKKDYSEFSWSREKDKGDHIVITGKRTLPSLNVKEKMLLIYFRAGDGYQLSVTHDVKGDGWDREGIEEILRTYQTEIDQYSVFYTIQGHTSLKEDLDKETESLLTKFSAKEMEQINERNFVSVSAMTDKWENSIPLGNGRSMNLHIAYRNSDNGVTTVTIGTPIITSEY